MGEKSVADRKALENVGLLLDEKIMLPENVFRGGWGGYYFFDPAWVTDKDFVEEAMALRAVEGSQSVCLWDLNRDPESPAATFFFNNEITEITSTAYDSFLRGPNTADGALRKIMARYGCASDAGEWCIYCEMQNEIGVIAIRDHRAAEKYMTALDKLGPLTLAQAIAEPLTFVYGHLEEKFRIGLLEHYAMPGA